LQNFFFTKEELHLSAVYNSLQNVTWSMFTFQVQHFFNFFTFFFQDKFSPNEIKD